MNKIICLRGIPASGKSTWAKKQSNAKVISKDQLRKIAGITPENWSKEKENKIIEDERKKVIKLIKDNTETIIIDNTHLGFLNKHIVYYRDLAKQYEYDFEIKDFYISREEAIERDKNRDDSVGEKVINKMIKMQGNNGYPTNPVFRKTKEGLPNAYIVDIDGTLAYMRDKRSPYDYSKVAGDDVNPFLRGLLMTLAKNNEIIIVSGRSDECVQETKQWLEDNLIPHSFLFMRKKGDKRKDCIIKKEIYCNHIKDRYNILGVFDDRNQVVDMWRLELQLPTYQCWYGNF